MEEEIIEEGMEVLEETIDSIEETLDCYRNFIFQINEEKQEIQDGQKLLKKLLGKMKKK